MKLLIVTQVIDKNHPILGFFHRWVEEFAKQCEHIEVICLQKGEHAFSSNVTVHSLGKEHGVSRLSYVTSFFSLNWKKRKHYDAVFVHMNPEYIVLVGWFWRMLGKKVALWYTHKQVNAKLRIAALFSNIIFSASKKSFRLDTKKLQVTGHAIDTDKFSPEGNKMDGNYLLQVGRISKTKGQLEAVKVLESLGKQNDLQLRIVGQADDEEYVSKIRSYAKDRGLHERVQFVGPVPHEELPKWYRGAVLVLNMSKTGSLDKDVLEAMACNTPLLTTNEAYQSILDKQFFSEVDHVSEQASNAIGASVNYRDIIVKEHNLEVLIKKLVNILSA